MATRTRKSTKKTAPKKTGSSFASVKTLPKRFPSINPIKITIVLLIAGVIALLYFFQDQFMFAKVNGKPITTGAVLKELETVKRNEVSEVVNIMIDKSLLMQEADKRGVEVSEEEINKEMQATEDQLKQSGQSLDNQLALLGMTREGLRENYRIQKSVEQMLGESKVTDEEIADYMEENKDLLPQDQDEEQLRNMVRDQLTQQKLSEKYQELITKLRNDADIQEFRPYLNQAGL